MKTPIGKYACLLVCTLMLTLGAIAQTKHFLFLQAANNKPFTVSVDDRDFNSSQHGYAAVSQLGWGRYLMEIRFLEKGKNMPIRFVVEVKDTDLGFELIEAGQGNWILKDLVSGKTIDADKASMGSNGELEQPFGQLLPALVQDKAPVMTKPADSSILVVQPITAPALPGKISRTYTLSTQKGLDLVFVDKTGDKADTIVVHIPENEVVLGSGKPGGTAQTQLIADQRDRHSFASRSQSIAAIIPSRWPDISLK